MPKTKAAVKRKPKADDTAKKIKLHQEAIQKGTPLSIIREKEIEINKKVMEAQQKADANIAKARKEAEKIRQEALEKAPQEAQDYFKDEVSKAEKEAKKIESTAAAECEKVKKTGLANYDKAVSKLMEIILP